MELGTVKTEVTTTKKTRRNASLSGHGGGNRGGGRHDGGGGSGGGSGGNDDAPVEQYEKSFSKSKVLTWFLLIVVLMTFGGLIGAYIVISTNGVLEWRPFSLPLPVYLSTLLILASSYTYIVAERAIGTGAHLKSKNWLIATTVLGGMFISSQLLAWLVLVNRGFYMASNPYAAFFYIMTALHAVHVVGGVIALGYIMLRNWARTESSAERTYRTEVAGAVGWYWHFMGGLWIVLLGLLGFWK